MKTETRTEPRVDVSDVRVEQHPGGDTQALKARVRMLGWLSAILAIAVIALGAWLIFDGGESADDLTATQEQTLETLDAYLEAWNDADGAAAVALMTPNGYHDNLNAKYYANPSGSQGSLERLVDSADSLGFSVSRSDVTFVGPWVVNTEHRPAGSANESLSLFYMNADGTKIVRHIAY